MTVTARGASVAFLSFLFAATAAAQSADLFVTKSAPASASVGSNVTFTISLGNGGPDDAASASFTDTLPGGATFVSLMQTSGPTFICSMPTVGDAGGTVTCSIATLPAGAGGDASFDIVVNVSAGAAGTSLINGVVVSSQTPDDNSENNTSFSGTSIPGGNLADIAITKSGPVAAPPNGDVTYTITVTNLGPNTATSVAWTDTRPGGAPPGHPMTFVPPFQQTSGPSFSCPSPGTTVTCSISTFASGATATFSFTGNIPNGTPTGTIYSNVATVTS